ncbi:MAG: LysM peptidoglycan-binding domain-containing protein [Lachnospiraceae bacterium]|nr:LysM peptidoglycan-binding domain-containing protein [Lachnospiraceae bacterium]
MNTYRERSAYRRQCIIRKRMILLFVFTAFVILTVMLFLPGKTAAAKNEPTGTYRILSIEIETGDSLWSIATEYFTEDFGSIPSYIREIKRMNGLNSDTLYAGDYIVVPCYLQ